MSTRYAHCLELASGPQPSRLRCLSARRSYRLRYACQGPNPETVIEGALEAPLDASTTETQSRSRILSHDDDVANTHQWDILNTRHETNTNNLLIAVVPQRVLQLSYSLVPHMALMCV